MQIMLKLRKAYMQWILKYLLVHMELLLQISLLEMIHNNIMHSCYKLTILFKW